MLRTFDAGYFECIVIGAGHAGCEAALASARMGVKTLILSINLDSIAMMPCNPSIGGTGKGHLVKEIDALGGEMGLNIDKSFVQSKMLNSSKGPAVHSLRAQADKHQYHTEMKKVLENTENLYVKQAEVTALIIEDHKIKGVITSIGSRYRCDVAVLSTGTYLGSTIFIGDAQLKCGPNGLSGSYELVDSLNQHEFDLRRFKTGTPARVDKRSLDFDKMEVQWGDQDYELFSFMNDDIKIEELPCWLTYTNNVTHEIILNNLDKSGLFTGVIEGTGPRYCPSIETKLQRFTDKPRHQLFIEPEGRDTNEMYIQGMSTSLAEDVQLAFMRSIPGMEACEIMRPAYAIEYDCINPLMLNLSLELKTVDGLFSAGQFNGTSGYEEAAAQGLIAGINAALKFKGKEPFILDRSEAYIGVLIDDLVTKGTDEPYRMMTSRAEYRLILRQDNADLRLTQKGYDIGLVNEDRYLRFQKKLEMIDQEYKRIQSVNLKMESLNEVLLSIESSPVTQGTKLIDILRRPEVFYKHLEDIDETRPEALTKDVIKQIEVSVKYEGYIKKQMSQIEKFKALEEKKLPVDLNYNAIESLRLEARQKLSEIKPDSIGQASRISGVSPSDISVLLVYMEQQRRRK
ncbi:tRNA uridine-5-carboxymethylaminomethyl(34) synthesis enzyme MnmG [Fusibacter ferrireducens]|uniref:tRNA uridine 5-carboxymethylaminomethyl modification enzyme MnmG n=1 Tax=Fusibacter ferrireducens TaxID=2785058 RepID=A0ABR9ZY96_9FIRM|nr:tRNA uridine-5-carboxymethylaminomethyl(34) synthesis enzyme MnmG [Fusibacter ferrireducens]MBF4695442.1 tRNA uridine-5-carboxymethylaminomethyl(34) synthesis enzyme MnmG [Fusibacter ferrireducens]